MVTTRLPRRLAVLRQYWRGRHLHQKYRGFTMIPQGSYWKNLAVAEQVQDLPGCVVECGTWKGGMLAGLVEVLGLQRSYFGFDSFEGLPPADERDGRTAQNWQSDTASDGFHDNCRASREDAERAVQLAGATHYSLIKGWFEQTLPGWTAPQPIALLRLDGDWYESTMTCLTHLAPQMAPGGLMLIDDYYAWDGCTRAIHDWLSRNDLPLRIRQAHNDVCYLQMTEEALSRCRAAAQPHPQELATSHG